MKKRVALVLIPTALVLGLGVFLLLGARQPARLLFAAHLPAGQPAPVTVSQDTGHVPFQGTARYVAPDGADAGDCSTVAGRCRTI